MELLCPSPTTGRKPLASKGGKHARRTCGTRHPKGDKDMATTKSTKRHTSKAERQQARERAQAALDRLGEGVRAVYDSERWESWLRSLSRFYDYSLGNTILIAMQMPTATHVASFRSWKRDFNRYVKKGEKGIEILVPMLVKDRDEDADEERRRLVGFRVGHVFDVSQTDGDPLPTLVDEVAGDVDLYAAILDAVRAVSAYPVEFVGDLPEGTNGFFRRGELVAIREGMSEGQTVKTALHELAHSRLHDGDPEGMPDRAMREVQAESVAYAVSAALGLDTSGYSFGYVASWAVGKTDEEMRACLQVVRDAAKAMVEDLQQAMAA
ncbi:hypothetical protein SAMN06298223_1546 [Olsenella sp. KH1P3]|uniref:N-terminal domain-containing protein n=2 Tax=Coriobacteriales TaxID=84999 RepID=A0A1H6JNH9_9ACTN|nr:hypothetical protein SAMN05216447_10873 [Parafannyhessea umbonata]SJZ83251.1 hypothetical protein SAMN06298223_1546 [Olsenella sp. KH1P3]